MRNQAFCTVLLLLQAGCADEGNRIGQDGAADRGVEASIDVAVDRPAREASTADRAEDAPAFLEGGVPCGQITTAGCCHGQTLYYCETGELKSIDCTKNAPLKPDAGPSNKCGWNSTYKYYDCTGSDSPDPSGANPRACAGFPDGGMEGPPKDSPPTESGVPDTLLKGDAKQAQ